MLLTPGTLVDGTRVDYGFGWHLNFEGDRLVSVDHGGGGSGTTAARNFVRRYLSDRTTIACFAQERPSLDLDKRKTLITAIYKAQQSIITQRPKNSPTRYPPE